MGPKRKISSPKKSKVIQKRNTPTLNRLMKEKKTERIIEKLKLINEEISGLGGVATSNAEAQTFALLKERARTRVELQKLFPGENISQFLQEHGLESSLEIVLRKNAEKGIVKVEKERRPSFSEAKRDFFEKSGFNEKTYSRLRMVYLENHPGVANFGKREIIANNIAKLTNVPFGKAMNFVNFAQRYPGMFKKR